MQQAFGKSDSTAKLGIGAAGVVYRLALGNAVSILAAGILSAYCPVPLSMKIVRFLRFLKYRSRF